MLSECLLGLLGLLLVLLLWTYGKTLIISRNEAEYRDIVEYQTMLASALLQQVPEAVPALARIRYFPDRSGFFLVLDFQGQVLCHGDYDGKLQGDLPFHIPVAEMVTLARSGGGYVKYNYKGFIYESFVYASPDSPFIVCSGLFNDLQHIQDRYANWQRVDKTILKVPSTGAKKRASRSTDTSL